MSLENQMETARPGDRVTIAGRMVGGKIQGVRGTEDAWIELVGEDDTATIIPEPGYTASALRLEDCEYLRLGGFKVDGEGDADRAVQVFTSDNIEIHDLETNGVPEDHVHIVGCNHVLIERLQGDGTGGVNMGGGKGPHLVYFTRLEAPESQGGGDCEDLVARDCDCINIAGAAYQANGDGARLAGVVFERCRAENYGRLGGSGVNLAQCDNPELKDLILVPHEQNDNPGIASYDGTFGTTLERYIIECDQDWSGPMDATAGTPIPPAAPVFGDEEPEPPEPPEPTDPTMTISLCVTCDGTGRVLSPNQTDPPSVPPATMACPTCGGRGTIETS